MAKPVKPGGIPKSSAAAAKLGFKKVKVNFAEMKAAEKRNWVPFSEVKPGGVALVRAPSRRPGPVYSPSRPGYYIVCYYNPHSGRHDLDCHEVPADSVGESHLDLAVASIKDRSKGTDVA